MSRSHASAPGRRPPGPGCLATEDGIMGLKERGAITGIGETAYSRNSGKSVVALQMEASLAAIADAGLADRKSTRLNSSHLVISYAVFCLKKKKQKKKTFSTKQDV